MAFPGGKGKGGGRRRSPPSFTPVRGPGVTIDVHNEDPLTVVVDADAQVVWKQRVYMTVSGLTVTKVEFVSQSEIVFTFNAPVAGRAWSVPYGLGETSYGDFTLPASGVFAGGGVVVTQVESTNVDTEFNVSFSETVDAIGDRNSDLITINGLAITWLADTIATVVRCGTLAAAVGDPWNCDGGTDSSLSNQELSAVSGLVL